MKEFLGRIKADFLLSSVLCIALGLVFIIWRASVLTIVANVLAVVLIIIGVVYMCSYFLNIVTNGLSALLGLMVLAVGIWFLVQPQVVVSLIPIVIGLVLIFHSIRSIIEAVDARIRALTELQTKLYELEHSCHGHTQGHQCGIIQELSAPEAGRKPDAGSIKLAHG